MPTAYGYYQPQSLPGAASPGGSSVAAAHAAAVAKKKGMKSTLGRIFGKKDKQLKAMKVAGGAYVTGPAAAMTNSPSGGSGFGASSHPAYSGVQMQMHAQQGMMHMDMGVDSMQNSDSSYGLAGNSGGDYTQRKKKK
jgi:hypothetical protein